ncbi:ribonuclease III [Candidatus Shapirobacteria bacterium]|nr:ribonuclease III [Candidatus Shapirobacteria bacterium]
MFNPSEIEKTIGIIFKDKNWLKKAFTHRSYLNEERGGERVSNERLEFLGDAILEFWISEKLFNLFPDYPEGKLTNFRSRLVCTPSLAKISRRLNLGNFLLLSRGEEKENGRENPSLLANTFEALVGAIYQDQGLKKTAAFLEKQLKKEIKKTARQSLLKDYKSYLQEIIQEKEKITPSYKLLKSSGPAHKRKFVFAAMAGGKKIGEGRGASKQEAQQKAAQQALEKLGLVAKESKE